MRTKRPRPEPQTWIGLYTGHPDGGCKDIGTIQLNDHYTIVRTIELTSLKQKATMLDTFLFYFRGIAENKK